VGAFSFITALTGGAFAFGGTKPEALGTDARMGGSPLS